ncbi:MAG: glycosyltransferase family 2 protein [Rikenellaceae bacterium]
MKVSVIVPIYGVEKYIERCARSLFEQTLNSIEYLFVDDCSPDASIEILEQVLEEYPHRKSQVRIIRHETNKGAAIARKNGILAATGEYLIHCDSDDWVDRDMYRAMYAKAIEEGVDVVLCSSWYNATETNYSVTHCNTDYNHILQKGTMYYLWLRLVRRQLFIDNLIIFPIDHMMEDIVFTIQTTYYSSNYALIDAPYYYYYRNQDSICVNQSEEYCKKRWQQAKNNIDIVIGFMQRLRIEKQYTDQLTELKMAPRSFLYPLLKKDMKYYSDWYNTYPELNKQFLFAKGLSLSNKVFFAITLLKLYPLVTKLKKYYIKTYSNATNFICIIIAYVLIF